MEKMFEINSFSGILGYIFCIKGGRPKAAHYFVGKKDSDLIYLDPHLPQ